jgi:hypothetical protein
VVGIRRDTTSQDLVTWALVKVADAGVALHIAEAADAPGANSSLVNSERSLTCYFDSLYMQTWKLLFVPYLTILI